MICLSERRGCKQIDINCDMGESFGKYTIGSGEDMMAEVISTFGLWHAGSMQEIPM